MRSFVLATLVILSVSSLGGCDLQNPEAVIEKINRAAEDTDFDALKAWDEFEGSLRFRYAYLDRDDFDVDALLSHSKAHALKSKTALEFRRVLQKTSYAFTDPHFIVGPFEDDGYNIIPTSSDISVEIKQGRYFVNDVRAGSSADIAGVLPSWEVLAVNGTELSETVRLPFGDIIEAPTPTQLAYAATLVVNGRREGLRILKFNTGDDTVQLKLPSPRKFALRVNDLPILETSKIGTIGIIRIHNKLGDNNTIEAFDRAVNELSETSGLIIDLRNTPSGGNTEVARSIIGHFIKETKSYQIHEIPSLEREFGVPRRFIEQVKPRAPYYNPKNTVVLGGAWTGSMGEGIVIGLHGAAGVYTVASDMGDLLGGLRNINLMASNSRMDIGDEALFHIDGTPREDFISDIPLPRSDRDKNGEDPAIKEAIRYFTETK